MNFNKYNSGLYCFLSNFPVLKMSDYGSPVPHSDPGHQQQDESSSHYPLPSTSPSYPAVPHTRYPRHHGRHNHRSHKVSRSSRYIESSLSPPPRSRRRHKRSRDHSANDIESHRDDFSYSIVSPRNSPVIEELSQKTESVTSMEENKPVAAAASAAEPSINAPTTAVPPSSSSLPLHTQPALWSSIIPKQFTRGWALTTLVVAFAIGMIVGLGYTSKVYVVVDYVRSKWNQYHHRPSPVASSHTHTTVPLLSNATAEEMETSGAENHDIRQSSDSQNKIEEITESSAVEPLPTTATASLPETGNIFMDMVHRRFDQPVMEVTKLNHHQPTPPPPTPTVIVTPPPPPTPIVTSTEQQEEDTVLSTYTTLHDNEPEPERFTPIIADVVTEKSEENREEILFPTVSEIVPEVEEIEQIEPAAPLPSPTRKKYTKKRR